MKMITRFGVKRILVGCTAIAIVFWLVAVRAGMPTLDQSGPLPVYTFATMASAGEPGTNSLVLEASGPKSLAVDGQGNVFFAEMHHQVICELTVSGSLKIIAGQWDAIGSADGPSAVARFNCPRGIALDADGNIYVADSCNNTIRRITTNSVVSTLAGKAKAFGAVDGVGSEARFSYPCDLAVDASGMIYVADIYNCLIRKVTPGGVVTTFAGRAGESGVVNGRGGNAQFEMPSSIAVDAAGNVFVAEMLQCCIRKITPDGSVTTFVGKPTYSGGNVDGVGHAARFKKPTGLAVDATGNVYVADLGNRSIRRITPDSTVSTLASFSSEPNNVAVSVNEFAHPFRIALDSVGNIYLTDTKYPGIRKGIPAPADSMPLTLAAL